MLCVFVVSMLCSVVSICVHLDFVHNYCYFFVPWPCLLTDLYFKFLLLSLGRMEQFDPHGQFDSESESESDPEQFDPLPNPHLLLFRLVPGGDRTVPCERAWDPVCANTCWGHLYDQAVSWSVSDGFVMHRDRGEFIYKIDQIKFSSAEEDGRFLCSTFRTRNRRKPR